MDLISIIIPLYNKEAFLDECVRSILNQSYTNFEIIIVDDGSKDKSLQIAKKLELENDKITVIHQENKGVSTARNVGLGQSNGKWVMFVDPDDYISQECLQTLIENITSKTDIISSCCNVNLNNQKTINHFYEGNKIFQSSDEKRELYLQLMDSQYGQPQQYYTAIGVPWAKLYRRSFLFENNLRFNESLKRAQDNIFNMYAFYYANEIIYVDIPLYEYRYEHMDSYFEKYRVDLRKVFCTIYEERAKAIKKTGIGSDDIVMKFYLTECLKQMVVIFKNAAFHKKSGFKYSEKKKLALEIYNSGCFDNILSMSNAYYCNSMKYRLLWRIIKNRQFLVFNMLVLVFER